MSTDTKSDNITKSVLEFKSTSFSVPVLVISSSDLNQIEHQLESKITQAPEFFNNSPVLIDIQPCMDKSLNIDLTDLVSFLHAKKLFPIGLSGGNKEHKQLALNLNIPVHIMRSSNTASSTPAKIQKPVEKPPEPSEQPAEPLVENMLIAHPIRSGQRIYAKGDLTILSHVSAGAEVMAEGNIHIYGSLRGKALAGVQGNTKSRIFCSDLQAELVSVAGHYKISEELDKVEHNQPTQIFLQDQAILIRNIQGTIS